MPLRAALQVFVLAFLLLSLQLEARVHPLVHAGDQIRAAAQKGTVAATASIHCARCDLLAGGGDTPSSGPGQPARDAPGLETAAPAATPRAATTFVPYLGRAPPAIS